jgi:Tol biopolymer transport system component
MEKNEALAQKYKSPLPDLSHLNSFQSQRLAEAERRYQMQKSVSIILLLIVGLTSIASAGWKTAKKSVKLIGGDSKYFMHPRWSPDGAMIAFTESNYKGLWVMKADGTEARQITNEVAAGFGFEWAANANAIISRVAKYEKRFRYNAVKLFDLEKNETRLLTDYRTLMPGLPHWADADQKVYMYNRRKLEIFDSGLKPATLMKTAASRQMQFLKEDKIAIGDIATGAYKVFEPLKGQQCLNMTPSPDGKKVAFEIMGGNMYVMNADGTGLVDLGDGHRPQWAPDSEYLVYMITKDDGHNFLASDLYVIRRDGQEKTQLTATGDKLEMNPSWSADGKKIAFDVMLEGAIYVLEISK